MPEPTVCVALSVRNGERHLAESIESVLAQRGVELELRIFDNGSSDGSVAIATSYAADPRVTVRQNPAGLTFPHSMNLALEATAAEFFVAWACDDAMHPGNLARKTDALQRHGAGLVVGGWEFDDAGGERRRVTWPAMGADERVVPAPGLFAAVASANPVAMPSVVIRTASLREVGGFDTRPELTCDWLLRLRLGLRCDMVWLPEPLVLYRQHDDNGSSGAWREGSYARELLATVDEARTDARFPREWGVHAEQIETGVVAFLADGLARHGHRTLADSAYPAHAAIAQALIRHPGSAELRRMHREAVAAAGLCPPDEPCLAVLAPELEADTPDRAVALADRLRRAGLIDRCAVGVAEDDLDEAATRFGAALEGREELDVTLLPSGLEQLLAPGRLLIGRFGGDAARLAELHGVPAVTFGMPTPFGELAA
jgi:glycosyltransferase involved in cell wall biosynthesis